MGVVQTSLLQGEVDHRAVPIVHLHVEVLGLGPKLVQPRVVDGGQTCLGSYIGKSHDSHNQTKSCVKSEMKSHMKSHMKSGLLSHTKSVIRSHVKFSHE